MPKRIFHTACAHSLKTLHIFEFIDSSAAYFEAYDVLQGTKMIPIN